MGRWTKLELIALPPMLMRLLKCTRLKFWLRLYKWKQSIFISMKWLQFSSTVLLFCKHVLHLINHLLTYLLLIVTSSWKKAHCWITRFSMSNVGVNDGSVGVVPWTICCSVSHTCWRYVFNAVSTCFKRRQTSAINTKPGQHTVHGGRLACIEVSRSEVKVTWLSNVLPVLVIGHAYWKDCSGLLVTIKYQRCAHCIWNSRSRG